MDVSENSESQASDQQKLNGTPAKQSDSDYTYEDDFEELDSFIKEKSGDSSNSNSATVNSSDNSNRRDVFHKPDTTRSDSDSQQEKGQRESSGQTPSEKESQQKPASLSPYDDAQSDDSEPEPEGDVLFTDDQQRAMLELLAQKHDSGDYSDDPPEYNVKERLKELNAELAMEPDPDDRAHRVGFKAELVDLVAPPPDVSDEEDSPRKTLTDAESKDTEAGEKGDKKKQFVVERDGKFDVVADHELTASERAMFNIPGDEVDSKGDSSSQDTQSKAGGAPDNQANANNSNSSRKENQHPAPPSKPRPNTANGYSRRNVRPAQSPRPQTASSSRQIPSHSSTLQDFNYTSVYAMSPSEKERAQERARLREQQRKEEEARRKQEDEYRRQEAEDCFQAWLQRKRDEDRKKKQEDEERKKREGKDDRSLDSESKENEEAFKGWLKEKQGQQKREKLLKKREEQEIKDGYYVRSREECDQAYKEWLKRKYAELKRQKVAEKQRVRSFRSQVRRTRKQQMMARAVRQSQAFRYVDYYGYRF